MTFNPNYSYQCKNMLHLLQQQYERGYVNALYLISQFLEKS